MATAAMAAAFQTPQDSNQSVESCTNTGVDVSAGESFTRLVGFLSIS